MSIYRYFHLLSLDIVLGVIASTFLASRILEVDPGWSWWVALPLSVWILYAGDHLLDVRRLRGNAIRALHIFFLKHFRVIGIVWLTGLVADAFLILVCLDRALLLPGSILGAVVVTFYGMRHIAEKNQLLFIPGEIVTAAIYVAGTWLGPFVMNPDPAGIGEITLFIMFALVVFMNTCVISVYDIPLDTSLGNPSLARSTGAVAIKRLVSVISFLLILLYTFLALMDSSRSTLIGGGVITGMGWILFWILHTPSLFGEEERYRIASDAVLYLGFLSFLV